MMEQLHVMTDFGMHQMPNTVLATRGPHLKLLEVPWSNRDTEAPIEVATLLLLEYAPAGEIRSVLVYEDTDMETAMRDLEERDRR